MVGVLEWRDRRLYVLTKEICIIFFANFPVKFIIITFQFYSLNLTVHIHFCNKNKHQIGYSVLAIGVVSNFIILLA